MPGTWVPLPQLTRELQDLADANRSVAEGLRRRAPLLWAQLRQDRGRRSLLALWGQSRNKDLLARQTIVHPKIAEALGEVVGVDLQGIVVHAGVMHSYGYLLSNLRTPYGSKRSRWVRSDITQGLGLPPTLLSPRPKEGTLLGNLSWVLARLTRGEDDSTIAALLAEGVPDRLARWKSAGRPLLRLDETLIQGKREIIARSDIILFGKEGSDPGLLIHSLISKGKQRLITAFPQDAPSRRALLEEEWETPRESLRFNAHFPGFDGEIVRRSVLRSRGATGRIQDFEPWASPSKGLVPRS